MNINTNIYKQYVKSGNSCSRLKYNYSSGEKVSSSSKTDSFSLSSEASMFRECGKTIKNAVAEITSPASDDRIASLKSRIENGNYFVSSGQIADAILDRLV
ncbi:flagellar biosynthesis anti-sigma factor FlgM [Porcipelethomonas sp.]|uniref:flagellar biosynthesis anti-sigma factor FlgM n=1 Tax=Porcipelethomonas sp. TaxID=2981675 RepID=UPI003EF27E7E